MIAPLFLAVSLVSLSPIAVVGSPKPSPPAAAQAPGPDVIGGFDIRSSSIDYNYTSGDYEIPTRFTATNAGTDISADRAKGNSRRKIIVAGGNVVIHQTHPKPTTLTCDHIDADGKTKMYAVSGHVHFLQGQRDASADRGMFNDAAHQVHLEGHVIIKDQGQTLSAEAVDYNTDTGEGTASGNVTVISPVGPVGPPAPQNTTATKARKHG